MCMSEARGRYKALGQSFTVIKDAVIVVPAGIPKKLRNSIHHKSFPETPRIVGLVRAEDNGMAFPGDTKVEGRFKMFVPDGIKPGDKLRIDWAEGDHACAVFA